MRTVFAHLNVGINNIIVILVILRAILLVGFPGSSQHCPCCRSWESALA